MQRSVRVFTPSYDAFSSWFAAGVLAHVNVEEATAINEAVIKGDLQTAKGILHVVRQGTLSGSSDPLALKNCTVLIFKEHSFLLDVDKTSFWESKGTAEIQ